MSCRKTKKLIDLYLDGEATNIERDELFAHTQTCAKCKLMLNESRKFNNVLASVSKIDHPKNLHNIIMKRIQSDEGRERRSFIVPAMAWVNVAIVIMMTLFSIFLIKDKSEPIIRKPQESVVYANPEIQIVSPKEDSVVTDKFIDISALISSGNFKNVRVILDGQDITEATEIKDDFLIYTSDSLKGGHHKVIINADDEKGISIVQRSWEFYVIPSESASISKSSGVS